MLLYKIRNKSKDIFPVSYLFAVKILKGIERVSDRCFFKIERESKLHNHLNIQQKM